MLHLFDGYGIELEYMIVDVDSLDVLPISDRVLQNELGEVSSELDHGEISWSNELTHHVIELKTNGPAASLSRLADHFQNNVQTINAKLADHNARLMPSAMHPWMNPGLEMQLWPYEYHTVYETFHKIFDCRSHGWANLQSMHINLPFYGDEEFGRLHAAVRLILPLLPALAASSPYKDSQLTGQLDSRLDVYRRNAKGLASIAGRIIPEPVFDQFSYDREIFQPMFRDIAPYDPDGVLQNEFLNSRGAIARFSRGTIEIRVIDVQECPRADLAIAALTVAVLKMLVAQTWTETWQQQSLSIDDLEPVFLTAIDHAGDGVIEASRLLQHFGIPSKSITLAEVWRQLYEEALEHDPTLKCEHGQVIETILNSGSLAKRIVRATNGTSDPKLLQDVYGRLADCLSAGEMFLS